MKHRFFAAIAWAIAGFASLPAQGQGYPYRPIRVILPDPPGSVSDVIARAAANELCPKVGQSVIIENCPGANFIIGAQACASAPPDGYTLCMVNNNSLSINPLIYNSLPYDEDFTPITNLYLLVEALAVSSAVGINSVAELQSMARVKPHALNFGTLGEGF